MIKVLGMVAITIFDVFLVVTRPVFGAAASAYVATGPEACIISVATTFQYGGLAVVASILSVAAVPVDIMHALASQRTIATSGANPTKGRAVVVPAGIFVVTAMFADSAMKILASSAPIATLGAHRATRSVASTRSIARVTLDKQATLGLEASMITVAAPFADFHFRT